MSALFRDVQYGIRSLARDRGFAATVFLTLAITIAANTATFTVVRSILLKPLPTPDSDALVLMENRYPKAGVADQAESSAADYFDRMRAVTALESQAVFRLDGATIEVDGTPEQVRGMVATPSLFRMPKVAPERGRIFTDAEGEVGSDQKVILSHGLWQEIYGGEDSAIGSSLRLSGRPFTVVGVMPPEFSFFDPEVRCWAPLAFTASQKSEYHNNSWINIGRLKAGATVEQVQQQVNALNAANLDKFPQFRQVLINAGYYTHVERPQDMLVRDVKGSLYLLWGGALFVLLLGVLNLASLALARAHLRQKEIATRRAIGASAWHLTRQLGIESSLLGLTGGIAGLGLGAGLLRLLSTVGLENLPRAAEIHMDWTVIAFVLGLSVAAGILIGCAPLSHVFHIKLANALQESGRTGSSGRRARKVRQGLVVAQVGCAFALMSAAGLLLASFQKLLHVDPGFDTESVLTASVSLPGTVYSDGPTRRAFTNRAREAIRGVPGVIDVGVTDSVPFASNFSDSVILAEGYQMQPGESLIAPTRVVASTGYFEAMGIRLTRGRFFDDRDRNDSQRVVMVDERLANRFWPGRDPLGRRMYLPNGADDLFKTDEHTQWLYVVGVVKPARLKDLTGQGSPVGTYYLPYTQNTRNNFTFIIHTATAPAAAVGPLRAAIAGLDPGLALFDVRTMAQRVDLSLSSRKTSMMLAVGFGVLALFLAATGIYGLLQYLITHREREIGIRLAVGSTPGGIVRMVVREGLWLVAGGLVVGMGGTVLLRTAVEAQVYGVQPLDPFVLGSAVALLGVVAMGACLAPARRASKVDPVIVLNGQ